MAADPVLSEAKDTLPHCGAVPSARCGGLSASGGSVWEEVNTLGKTNQNSGFHIWLDKTQFI